MANQEKEFFVHTQGAKPQVIHAALDEPLTIYLFVPGSFRKAKMTFLSSSARAMQRCSNRTTVRTGSTNSHLLTRTYRSKS